MKKILSLLIAFVLLFSLVVRGEEMNLSCKSAVLMEAKTGEIIYEKNKDEAMPPASITKIMTLLIIMEELSKGNIKYDDIVVASEKAKSMGGSTIFLDAGEKMSVYDLVKGIVVASANDASVAMAEYIEGSVDAFVVRMNEKAKELGMNNTTFVNTNGLDEKGHVSSAYDIALMSRALLSYPDIFKFTTIWTDSLRDGKFDLANTNKLIRFYEGANGLKTGSTDEAGCCISATAKRDDMQLIAVVMNAPSSNDRFSDARAMLDYGFSNHALRKICDENILSGTVRVLKGEREYIEAFPERTIELLDTKRETSFSESEIILEKEIFAPISKGQKLGKIICRQGDKIVLECPLVAKEDMPRLKLGKTYITMIKYLLRIE